MNSYQLTYLSGIFIGIGFGFSVAGAIFNLPVLLIPLVFLWAVIPGLCFHFISKEEMKKERKK